MTAEVRSALQGLGLIISLTIATVIGQYVWAEWSGQRARNEAVNPAVFEAFRAIERQCLSERWPHETVRCRGALDKLVGCAGAEAGCLADEVYCVLYELGFHQPSYFRSDSRFANQMPC